VSHRFNNTQKILQRFHGFPVARSRAGNFGLSVAVPCEAQGCFTHPLRLLLFKLTPEKEKSHVRFFPFFSAAKGAGDIEMTRQSANIGFGGMEERLPLCC
jgi:hypothetical protein